MSYNISKWNSAAVLMNKYPKYLRISAMLSVMLSAVLMHNLAMGQTGATITAQSHSTPTEQIKRIKIGAAYWEGFSHSDGSGLFLEIMKQVYQPLGIELEIVNEPFKRARLETINHQLDVVVGTYSQDYRGNDLLLTPKYPINTEYVVAVFHADNSLNWQSFYQRNRITNRAGEIPYTSAWVIGYNYDHHLGIKKISEVKTMPQGLKMVANKRLGVFIDNYADVMRQLDKYLPALKSQLRWEIVTKRNLYMAFSNNPKAANFCKQFDQRMAQMLANGDLQRLFNKWQVDFSKVEFAEAEKASPQQPKTYCQASKEKPLYKGGAI